MEITPNEAQESLNAIQTIVKKTRRMIASSGAYKFMLLWGVIWVIGFMTSQFIQSAVAGYVWAGLNVFGGLFSAIIGIQLGRRAHTDSSPSGIRIGAFWWLLAALAAVAILIVWPIDWKQVSMLIILFVMTGWIAMGLLLSISSVKPSLAIIALALIGYYLLPTWFFLWMAVLGGGGMIALGLYIRSRW